MKRTLALAASTLLAALAIVRAADAATLDPNVHMFTLETPHFRVNYEEGYDDVAQKGAAYAEEAYDEVTEWFHTTIKDKVELTLFDHEDEVNGLALPYVSSAVYVYLTTPDSDLLWGRYDDWMKLVITHEFTHITHFETVDGVPSLVNSIFGRMLFPNLFQPTFLIEGLAVTSESLFTNQGKGGRGNDGYFDMYLRGDVLNNRQLSLDQAGGYYLTDFPGGDAPYVYGTFFYKYITLHYGADKPTKIAHAYSAAPWLGIDAACAQVIPGHTCQDLWDEMLHWLRRRAQVQLAEIKSKPVTPTTPLTHTSYHHHHPAYLPDGRLMFIDGQRHGFTSVKIWDGRRDAKGEPILTPLFNHSQYGDIDVSADGRYIFYNSSHGPNNYSSYDDIYRLDIKTGEKKELTEFQRMNNPGVSPDGKFVLAVQNGRGNTNLVLLDAEGKKLRQVTDLKDNTQFTAPRWSPDGKQIVCSAWRGSSRDIYMIDTTTWQTRALWKDLSVDVNPHWTPDGKYIIFSSDRDNGVWNLYAFDWRKRELFQVTNVLTGVIEPAISPDGKTLAMCYCNGNGYDIHTMPLDPATWRKVETPGFDPAIKPYQWVQKTVYPSHAYNPLPSMTPHFWSPIYQSGQSLLGIFTIGYDVLLTNTVFGLAGYSVVPPANLPQGLTVSPLDLETHTFLYQNSQLPVNFSVLASGSPFKYSIPLANGSSLDLYQRLDQVSFTGTLSNLPSPLTNSSYQTGDAWDMSYNIRWLRNSLNTSTQGDASDYNKAAIGAKLMPAPGRSNSVALNYKYNDNGKYGYSSAPEFGTMNSWGIEVAHPLLGSEVDFYRVAYDWRHFTGLPWTHHTLAFRLFGGLNLGKPQGDFYLGGSKSVSDAGTPDVRVASDPNDLAIALRGYPFANVGGSTAGLFSAEYRFPLLDIQKGVGPLPLFAERLYGAVFSDNGVAYTNNFLSFAGRTVDKDARSAPQLKDFRSGLGAEVRLNFKIANNPLNTVPLATIARSALPALNAFNDSAGVFRFGIAQPLLPITDTTGKSIWTPLQVYTEFGTFF